MGCYHKRRCICLILLLACVLCACEIGNNEAKTSLTDNEKPKVVNPSGVEAEEVVAINDSSQGVTESEVSSNEELRHKYEFRLEDVPSFEGEPYVELNGNKPLFDQNELNTDAFEKYSNRDRLNRCGVAFANICRDTMPTEERGPIGMVRPSGWHTIKYNDIIEGNYLYNRCHLIGYQLGGENANEDNLITGTRYLNVRGMLPFENQVADYVKNNDTHVLYRVTPVFEGEELLARGVIIEAESVEDEGKEICFNVFIYNVQPGVVINYSDGSSIRDDNYEPPEGEKGYVGE